MLSPDQFYIPDGAPITTALSRSTHLGIATHPDDLEIMASHGILECFGREDQWFFGIVATDGAGSPRGGPYAAITNDEMIKVRRREQEKAAALGGYSGVAFLNYSSAAVKSNNEDLVMDSIRNLIIQIRPQIIYTHNPADWHETHVAVVMHTIDAIRGLPDDLYPEKLLGCEVWGSLDWVPENKRLALPLSSHLEVALSLLAAHDSQVAGGKRYDLAAQGRWAANATFSQSYEVDQVPAVSFALDLTPLIEDKALSISRYTAGIIDRFKDNTLERIARYEKEAAPKG